MTKNFGDEEQRAEDATAAEHEHRLDAESEIKRNPHPDFKKVEGSRPDWEDHAWRFSKTKNPNWKPGDGGNDGGESLEKAQVEIDPYAEGRPAAYNYKLLISAIIPRFIGFVSTRSEDGKTTNLSPFSYTTVINHDPPLFVIGFAGGYSNAKDTLRNLLATRECSINVISEHMCEAANSTSINAPYGTSEWAVSGLHPAACSTVACSRVREAVFAVEGKLVETKEFESRVTAGKKTGVMAIVEGTRFWVREDAVNEERSLVDPGVLRPVSRLGGITYGRLVEGFELVRPEWEVEGREGRLEGLVVGKVEGQ